MITEPTEAERLAEEGQRLYRDKKFAEAITAYLKAYNLSPAAILLYNIAFIYDKKLGELDLASEYYRRYATAEDADPQVVERALARLQAIKDLKKMRVVGPPDDGKDGDNGGKGPGGTTVEKRRDDGGTNVAAWATLITGGALVAGGVTFGILAQSTHDDFQRAGSPTDAEDRADTGKTQALVSDVLNIAGGAAIVTGVVLLIVDSGSSGGGGASDQADAPSSLRLGAQPAPGGALFVVSGSL